MITSLKDFEKFVNKKSIVWEHKDKPICPKCESENITITSSMSTLVGGNDPIKSNHYWHECVCSCSEKFIWEHKGGFQWYCVYHKIGSMVISGIHNCFENYYYECECGGIIKREYRQLDGKTDLNSSILKYSLKEGVGYEPHQRSFYVCDKCKKEIEHS